MGKEDKEKPLKPEWKVFAHEYVIDWNGTRAYMVAYPNVKENTAGVNACKLLGNTRIASYIEEIQKDLAKLAGVSALSNIKHLTDILEAEGEKKEATKDRIAALKVVNDMLGWNAPVKKNITLDDKTISPEEREARIAALSKRAEDDK
jgi:phage terminase small subunit